MNELFTLIEPNIVFKPLHFMAKYNHMTSPSADLHAPVTF